MLDAVFNRVFVADDTRQPRVGGLAFVAGAPVAGTLSEWFCPSSTCSGDSPIRSCGPHQADQWRDQTIT
jgi:hypothetical protein